MTAPKPPAESEVRVRVNGNEATFLRRQAVDRLGRAAESVADTMRAVHKDAQAWIRGQR